MTNVEPINDPNPSTEEILEELSPVSHSQQVESVIATLAIDQKVMVGHTEEGGYVWKFPYGSAEIFVQLTGQTDDDTFTVWSPVLKLPAKNEAKLTRKLLEMNWLYTLEGQFAIFDNQVVVLAMRTVADLSPGEIARAITLVANLADENDDALQAEFGQ